MDNNQLKPKEIPWTEAQHFAEKHNQDMIVVLTYSNFEGCEHVLTWGKTEEQSAYAAHAGEKLKLAIGWPAEEVETISAKTQKLIDSKNILLAACIEVRVKLLDIYGLFGGGHEMNKVFELLNNAIQMAETEVTNA